MRIATVALFIFVAIPCVFAGTHPFEFSAREQCTFELLLKTSGLSLSGHGCSPDWSVRLYPWYTNYGIVNVCYGGIWRTACHYDWTAEEAKVVCNQLGYTGGCRKCIYFYTQVYFMVNSVAF